MALPNQLKAARMSDATVGNTIDNHVGDLETAICDILGIPIGTNISAALFEAVAAGLKTIILQDAAADPAAAGQLRRNATLLKYHDGSVVRTIPTILVPRMWVPAATFDGQAAAPCMDLPSSNGPVATGYGTSPNTFGALDFADGASPLTCQFDLLLPSDWSSSDNIDIKFIWFSGSTSTNSAVWTCATKSIADGEDVLNPSFNAAQTVIKANNAAANTRNSAEILNVTKTGFAAGERAIFRIGRDPTHASDNLAATAALLGVELTYRRNFSA